MNAVPTVTLTDEAGQHVWTGSLHAFLRDNEYDTVDAAFVVSLLRAEGRAIIGGGAAPAFNLELGERA